MEQRVFRHGDTKLTGIKKLRNKFKGETAVICCSGTTFKSFDEKWIPPEWTVFAVNETIRKMQARANYWVLSDDPIVLEYAQFCQPSTDVLCMHEGTKIIRRHCKSDNIYTVESMSKIRNYDNGFEFFSRGTVMIGAIEMARYMGFKTFYIFGHDCYRLNNEYYYDGRKPIPLSENSYNETHRVIHKMPVGSRVYVTPRLRAMIKKLEMLSDFGLWRDIEVWCVNSPLSQQTVIPKMDLSEFQTRVKEWQDTRSKETPVPEPKEVPTSQMTQTASESSSSSTQPSTSRKRLVLKKKPSQTTSPEESSEMIQ
jgi:hypothetical protein